MNKEAKSSKLFTLLTGETVMKLGSYKEYVDLKSLGCTVGWLLSRDNKIETYSLQAVAVGTPPGGGASCCSYYVLVDSDNAHND